jgi:hypothetical protein
MVLKSKLGFVLVCLYIAYSIVFWFSFQCPSLDCTHYYLSLPLYFWLFVFAQLGLISIINEYFLIFIIPNILNCLILYFGALLLNKH